MSSSVDVSDRTKSRLEELQAEIEAATDREVSRREVLERLVEQGYDSKAELVDSFCNEVGDCSDDEWEGLSEEEIEAFFGGSSDWDFETTEEEIDGVLYGR